MVTARGALALSSPRQCCGFLNVGKEWWGPRRQEHGVEDGGERQDDDNDDGSDNNNNDEDARRLTLLPPFVDNIKPSTLSRSPSLVDVRSLLTVNASMTAYNARGRGGKNDEDSEKMMAMAVVVAYCR